MLVTGVLAAATIALKNPEIPRQQLNPVEVQQVILSQSRPVEATHSRLVSYLRGSKSWQTGIKVSFDNGRNWSLLTLTTNGPSVSNKFPVSIVTNNLSIITFHPNGTVEEVRDFQGSGACPQGFRLRYIVDYNGNRVPSNCFRPFSSPVLFSPE